MNDLFVLILTVCLNGECNQYVEDSSLSLDDCKGLIMQEFNDHKLQSKAYEYVALNVPLTSSLSCVIEDVE